MIPRDRVGSYNCRLVDIEAAFRSFKDELGLPPYPAYAGERQGICR